MEDTLYGRRDSEARRRRQQDGTGNASSFAASATWNVATAEDGNSYLAQRKEQIYGVFADEVEDEVEEEQAARKTQKKTSSGRLLLVSGSSSSESDEGGDLVDGQSSGESEDDAVPEGCVTGARRRNRNKEKSSSGRYGRRVQFVEGGVWKPETGRQQKRRKTGDQSETGRSAVRTSSASVATASEGASREEGEAEEGTSSEKNKQCRPAPTAGVFEEEAEEDETETNEAGCMSLRERILNAQVLKEVLGDAYYELSSEDEDVKAAVEGNKQHEASSTAAGGTESSSESSSSGRSSVVTKAGPEGGDSAGAADAGGSGARVPGQPTDSRPAAGDTAGGAESSSSDDDAEEGVATTERATTRQRLFRFSNSARGEAGAQQGQHTAEGGAGPAQPAKERNTWGFAKMEKTYGVGFKLLKKMGFKGGGLGRHGTGVANPLEVRIREKNKGLQDSGEKLERKKTGRGKQLTALDILLGARKREKSAAGQDTEIFVEAWKKPDAGDSSSIALGGMSAAERRRRRLGGRSPAELSALRVEELQRSLRSSSSAVRRQGPAVRIIDMTGPEARLIENESELQQTLQQQKQRAAAAGGRRGRKLGVEKSGTEREKGRGEEDEWSDGALLSDEEPLATADMDEEESAEDARVRNLPFKTLRKQLETIVHAVEAQLESIARDKKVGEQMLLESVDYVPVTGAAGATAALLGGAFHGEDLGATGEIERSVAAADGRNVADFQTESNPSARSALSPTGATEPAGVSVAAAARLYEEEVATAVRDASVVADRAATLLQQVQSLYEQLRQPNKSGDGAAPRLSASHAGTAGNQAKGSSEDPTSSSDTMKKRAGSKSASRKDVFSRSGGEDDRWSGSDSSRSRSPNVPGGDVSRKENDSSSAAQSVEDASSATGIPAEGDADASDASSSSGTVSNGSCNIDLDSLVVAAEEWRSTARFEFRLLQLPAVLAALAGLVLQRRLQSWVPWEGTTTRAAAAEAAAADAASAAGAKNVSGTTLVFERTDGVTPSSVARLLAFLVSLQQHEEAETHTFLTAMTSAEEKLRASAAAGSTACWAAGLLAAAAPGAAPGGREVGGRGGTVAKCLQKWQEDEIARIEDEAFGARKRGTAASRRMRSTLGLFPLRLEGSTGTLRLLQLPMRECAEPYRLGFDILERVLQVALVNPLRAAIINNWQPEKEGEEELSVFPTRVSTTSAAVQSDAADSASCYRCLALMEKWSAVLPASCFRQIVEEAVVPKLLHGINMWDPSKARVPIHMWVQPWLPYLSREHLQLLSMPLQAKIAAALDAKWHPSDRSAVGLLLPWKNVFDAYSFAALLQRSVMPKLHDHLLNMPVRPDHQRLEPLQDVLAWVTLLPVEMLVNLFLTAFFPRWLQVLRVWLATPQVDLNEVLVWYGGWKQILPPALLAHPRVQSGVLVEALQLMNFASAAVGMQAVGVPGAPAAGGVSPHLQQPPPPAMAPTSALPHVSPLRPGVGLSGATDPTAATATSASPGYMLHRDLGVGVSPFPAPPPTAAPPPPPSLGPAVAGHTGAAAPGSRVGDGVACGSVKPAEPEEPISLLEYLEGLAKERNILFKPKPGRVEDGKQVYAYGRMNMYVKEKLIYVKGKAIHVWTAVDVDELLKLAKGEWTKLKGTSFERK